MSRGRLPKCADFLVLNMNEDDEEKYRVGNMGNGTENNIAEW